jgi:hypothetical protein
LAQEVAYVEGDWAALGWALGSARVLLDYREAPIGSLADLPAAEKRFAESKRKGNATWMWMPIWVFIYGDKFFHARLAGWSALAVFWLCWVILPWRS